jgi:hypothetical protein
MADEDVQKTLEELSHDLHESKARLEEAQRVATSVIIIGTSLRIAWCGLTSFTESMG